TTHSARPSRSMSPAVTNPPNVKLASPNGSVGGTRVLPSLPLTTAITVFVPGPVTRTVSATPSPSTSAVAVRTATPGPPNGLTVADGVGLNWPEPFGANTTADPSAGPPTASGRPGAPTGAALAS